MRTAWNDLQLPVRISLLLGLTGAGVSLMGPFFYGWTFFESPLNPISYAVFFLPFPIMLTISASILLFRRMSLETRGILGFVVFVLSIITPFSPYILVLFLSVIRPLYTS